MIGKKAASHGSFSNLIEYQLDLEKNDLYETQNLMGQTPEAIAEEMQQVVDVANRDRNKAHTITSPTYHVSFSWAPSDQPTKDQMLAFGRDFIKYMKLDEHQAVIAIHNDTRHEHIHIVANKVHPISEEVWEGYDYEQKKDGSRTIKQTDYQKIERFEREYEKEFGWRITPGRHAGEWENSFDGYRPTQGQYHYEKRLGQMSEQLPDQVTLHTVKQRADSIKDQLYKATSFTQFDNTLARQGLYLEAKGQGAVITDGSYQVKASSVSRGFSGGRLEERFGESLHDYLQERELKINPEAAEQQVQDWTSNLERVIIEGAEKFSRRRREVIDAELHRLDDYDEGLNAIRTDIKESFQRTYENPAEAYQVFGRFTRAKGYEEAKGTLEAEPGRFGQVKDIGGVIDISKAVRDLDHHQGRYPKIITAMTQGDIKEKREDLTSEQTSWQRIDRSLAHHASTVARKGLQKSEAGKALDTSAANVIAVARLSSRIAKNPGQIGLASLKETTGKVSQAMDSQGGRVAGSVLMNTVKSSKIMLDLVTNPTGGSIKIFKNIMQTSLRLMSQQSRSLGRGR